MLNARGCLAQKIVSQVTLCKDIYHSYMASLSA